MESSKLALRKWVWIFQLLARLQGPILPSTVTRAVKTQTFTTTKIMELLERLLPRGEDPNKQPWVHLIVPPQYLAWRRPHRRGTSTI